MKKRMDKRRRQRRKEMEREAAENGIIQDNGSKGEEYFNKGRAVSASDEEDGDVDGDRNMDEYESGDDREDEDDPGILSSGVEDNEFAGPKKGVIFDEDTGNKIQKKGGVGWSANSRMAQTQSHGFQKTMPPPVDSSNFDLNLGEIEVKDGKA